MIVDWCLIFEKKIKTLASASFKRKQMVQSFWLLSHQHKLFFFKKELKQRINPQEITRRLLWKQPLHFKEKMSNTTWFLKNPFVSTWDCRFGVVKKKKKKVSQLSHSSWGLPHVNCSITCSWVGAHHQLLSLDDYTFLLRQLVSFSEIMIY